MADRSSPTLLAIRPGALGDTLLTLSALRALRASFRGSNLHLVGHPGAAQLLAAAGEIDGWTDFDAPEVARLFVPERGERLLKTLSPITAAVAWLADPEGAIARNLRRAAADRVLVAPSRPRSGTRQHVSDYLLETLRPWGVATTPHVSALSLPRAATQGCVDVLVHPGSGSTVKNWPADRFGRALELLAQQHSRTVDLVCGPADESACQAVVRAYGSALNVLRPRSVSELAEQLSSAAAYLGNDSGVSHLAAAVGTPTTVLFGPTDPAVWAPRGEAVQVLDFDTAPEEVAHQVVLLPR